jgi:hypothetical protein
MQAVDFLGFSEGGLEVEDDLNKINAFILERGWGDGLPVIPPTEERVGEMLKWCDRPVEQPIAHVAPRYGAATPLRIAINAVMAGCEPRYFPLVMLAIEALCVEAFNLYSIQVTTHPCAPLLIFNGPIATEIGINGSTNAFGPGVKANATIGRAVRLALLNIGGAIAGLGDMATIGSPAKYTFCIAENETASPWEPLHVERGFPADATTVTVVGAECPHNVNDHQSRDAQGILTTVAGTMATTGSNDIYYPSQHPLLILGPEHAGVIAAGGYSKSAVKQFLQEHAWLPLGKFSTENIEQRYRITFKDEYEHAGADARVPAVRHAENILIVVAGGVGRHSVYLPTFGGSTQPVTMPLKVDGRIARTIDEFKRPGKKSRKPVSR